MKLSNQGSITAPILIISTAFIIVIYGLFFLLTTQFNSSFRQVAYDQALYIAEAGVQYYKWHLAHSPNDFTDGTDNSGPYVHIYKDNQGKEVGSYSLQIIPPENGSSIVTIKSTGASMDFPDIKRTVTIQYGIPSFAIYSNLSHAASWYGSNIIVNGQIHSNNGIRMDGLNTSIVSSSQDKYICGSETGCSFSNCNSNPTCRWISGQGCQCDGVWGAGAGNNLWQFPEPTIDFDSISFDFGQMRTAAQTHGLYLGPSGRSGYHIVFKNNGTFDLYQVRSTNSVYGYSSESGCDRLEQIIDRQTLIGNYTVASKPIIFLEDYVWVEGIVNGKTNVIAARFPIDSNSMNIWINNNLTYLAKDGNHSLGLIAQKDIYFVRNLPSNFEINAAMLAQKGKIIRHGYILSCGWSTYSLRNSITIYGSVISHDKSYWNFGDPPSSGFINRSIVYDPNLYYNPPPYFPTTGEYEFISWEEE